MSQTATVNQVTREVFEIVRPPRRLKVSEFAEEYVEIKTPGGYHGKYRNDKAPYMVEPMDNLSSRRHKGLIFMGPAQSGKTQAAVDNWIGYSIVCDPSDMTVIQTKKDTARDFSFRRIDRMLRNSPKIGEKKSPQKRDDNVFDKHFKTGQILSIAWPSIGELSGKAIKYMLLTDLDRMTLDVDGEGSPFDLALKRTTTFFSSGMTMAESSPGFVVEDRQWKASTPHEAPPAPGIASLYNRGDRRRWYWPCPQCNDFFEPTFDSLVYDEKNSNILEAAESTAMVCPHGCPIEHKHKKQMNLDGLWVPEFGKVVDGKIIGDVRISDLLSYWLQGPAAAFQTWKGLVINYLQATQEFGRTGDYTALKTTRNVDQGVPFFVPATGAERDPHALENRKDKTIKKRIVPKWVRFLIATVDVQGNRFDVQIQGTGPCETLDGVETVIVDRFPLRYSHRYDANGKSKPMDPGRYVEDWRILVEKVINKTYEVEGHEKEMPILMAFCDSGGSGDTTDNSYTFYRFLRSEKLHKKFMLVKGTGNMNAPRIELKYPDNRNRKDRKAQARGDVPVLFFNSNKLKDKVSKDLEREDPGPGFYHFPDFLKDEYFKGLTCEVRDDKTGKWECPSGARNEPFDHAQYHYGATLFLKIEAINWNKPPNWAAPFGEEVKPQRRSLIKKVSKGVQ